VIVSLARTAFCVAVLHVLAFTIRRLMQAKAIEAMTKLAANGTNG
jgi:hypothetical protein